MYASTPELVCSGICKHAPRRASGILERQSELCGVNDATATASGQPPQAPMSR